MSMIAHNRSLSMMKAYVAGRTSIYRNETKNPYPRSEPELRAEYERGVSEITVAEQTNPSHVQKLSIGG